MEQRSSPQAGSKRLRQQLLQLGGSPGGHTSGAERRQQRFWPCPVCNRSFALFRLEDHVNHCLDSSPSAQTALSAPLPTEEGSGVLIGEGHGAPTAPSWGKTSGLQRPLSGQEDAHCLPTERLLSLEGNLTQPLNGNVGEVLHSSGLQRSAFGRQQDALCLPTERFHLPQPPNQDVTLDSLGGNDGRECDTTDVWGENQWTELDAGDGGGLEEKGIVEEGRDGNGLAMDSRPPAGFKLFQRQVQSQARLSMFPHFASAPLQRKPSVTVLQPGMALFRSWLDLDTQQRFVQESQGVTQLFRRPTTAGGGKYHVYSMCWGPKWDTKAHRHVVEGPEHPIPSWMFELAQKLARDAHQHTPVYPVDSTFSPDVGLVNFYPVKAGELGVIGLGGHQDLDDSGLMPVVSVSVGDSMAFFYRRLPPFSRRRSGVSISVDEEAARFCEDGDAAHNREHQILLESGDVLVFGGKSRLVYHGTRHVQPGTRPPGLHMVPGRLNFTFRQTIVKTI